MTPEAKVKKKVAGILKKLGAYYFYPVTGGYGKSGVPDIIGCYEGKFFGIECKAGTNTPTALQEKNLRDIEHSMGIALVVNEDNIDEVELELTQSAAARSKRNAQKDVIPDIDNMTDEELEDWIFSGSAKAEDFQ